MIHKGSTRGRPAMALLAVALFIGACAGPAATSSGTPRTSPTGGGTSASPTGGGTSPSATTGGGGEYVIGVSNTVAGNGWREEMICSIKAEALASGKVSQVVTQHRTTDAAGQLEDMRTLINAGVDAIIVNPNSPDAVNTAIKEATDAGIVVVAVDQAVTEPSAYLLANNQEEYGYQGAKWLFEQMGGQGSFVYMRGAAGASADTDRDKGVRRAMTEYPNITIAVETQTGWVQDTGVQQINDFLATGAQFQGIWTSGIDNVIVDAMKTAQKPFVPIVGADNSGFVSQLLTETDLKGAAVTNPAAVGGAGLTLALQILDGQEPAEKQVFVQPEVWDNVSPEGKAKLEEASDPGVTVDPTWPLSFHIPDWTTYTTEQLVPPGGCKGPGE
jgi:ribose transport system substrate-binding protein